MSPSSSRRCVICNKPNSTHCSRCKGAAYCSKECQTKDWLIHKLLCADFATFNASDRPDDEHFRAIIFPVDEEKPKLVWLDCKWHYEGENEDGDDMGFKYQFPDIPLLVGPNVAMATASIFFNPESHRELWDPIVLNYDDNFLSNGATPNISILATSLSQPGHFYSAWRGQVAAYGMKDNGLDGMRYKDMDMKDFGTRLTIS